MVFAIHSKKRPHLPKPLPPRKPLRLIVAGCRHFTDPEIVERGMMLYLAEQMHVPLGVGKFWGRKLSEVFPTEIVHGACAGIDTNASAWAKLRNIPEKAFPADWDAHGKVAGPIRNQAMAEYADALLAFWDGTSRGTKSMISAMSQRMKPHLVLYVHPGLDPLPFILSRSPMKGPETDHHDRHIPDRKNA